MEQDRVDAGKLAYEAPVLVRLGKFEELTRGVGVPGSDLLGVSAP